MKWFLVIIVLILLSFNQTSKANANIKKKLLPELGYRLSGLLSDCKDKHFKRYVELRVERAVTKLSEQEQEKVIKNIHNKDVFLSNVIWHCYKQYIKNSPERKTSLIMVLKRIYPLIPDLKKQYLIGTDLCDDSDKKRRS
ncbi:MAG: hypothetical protein J6S74_03160 [Alphaproteobacteria bacterium]|nr:hypothetical protein [Alphaproteobacteria bacterium]